MLAHIKLIGYPAVLFLIWLIILPGCKEKKEHTPDRAAQTTIETPKGVFVKDGYLVFEDRKTYEATIQAIFQKDFETLDKWEKSLGFTSMRTANREAYRQYDEKKRIVRSPYFATLLSPDGRLQIGKEMWKVTKDSTYRTVDGVVTAKANN